MKILSLKSLNINSLKGKTELNFSELLEDNALFAITGPTGSGKSTLLDIISCALYGRTARLKNPNDLMSRHSGEAFCEVEFEIKGSVFRSSWTQKRSRKKADGKFQSAKMELSEASSGKIIKTGSRDVPKYIEELSGLDFDRFTQSMMLAQGSFDAFLKAKEGDRSALLEKITGTKIYADISKIVYEKYSSHKNSIELERKVLDNIELVDTIELKEKELQLEESKKQKIVYDEELKEIEVALNWTITLQKLLDDSIRYKENFSDIELEKEREKESFIKLDLATKALTLAPLNIKKIELEKQIKSDKLFLEQLNEKIKLLFSNVLENKKKYQTTNIKYQDIEKQYNIKIPQLKNIRTLLMDIEHQNKELQKNENNIKELENKKILTSEAVSKSENSLKKIKEKVEKLQNINNIYIDEYKEIEQKSSLDIEKEKEFRVQSREIEKLITDLKSYNRLILNQKKEELKRDELIVQEKVIKLNVKNVDTQIEELKAHIKTLRVTKEQETLIKNYEKDREKLVKGEACFLCGSKNHQLDNHNKNISLDNISATINEKEELEIKYELNLKKYLKEESKIRTKIENLDIKLEEIKSELESYQLIDKNEVELNIELTNIQNSLKTILDKRVEKEKVLQKRDNAKTDLEVEEKKFEEKNREIIKLDTELQQFVEQEKNLDKILKTLGEQSQRNSERLEDIAFDIKSIKELDSYEKRLNDKFKELASQEKEQGNTLNILQTEQSEKEKQKKELQEKIAQLKIDFKKQGKLFEENLQEQGFENEDDFKIASLKSSELEKLKTFCKKIDDRFNEVKTLKIDTEKKLQEHQEDIVSEKKLEVLQEEQKLSKENSSEVQRTIGQDEKELELYYKNEKKYQESISILKQKEKKFKVWTKMYELIGSADGAKFAKFAQGITLDQLIKLANQHLNILSSRYTLMRAKEQKQLLEIEVIDSFQGNVIRSVATLSGGESFIVSLALALGLSELASQKIAIDSLFLDEGFGTLDQESLETALNALNLLQSRGKMVGVISHVEALKERISLQIKVIPKGDGSSYIEV